MLPVYMKTNKVIVDKIDQTTNFQCNSFYQFKNDRKTIAITITDRQFPLNNRPEHVQYGFFSLLEYIYIYILDFRFKCLWSRNTPKKHFRTHVYMYFSKIKPTKFCVSSWIILQIKFVTCQTINEIFLIWELKKASVTSEIICNRDYNRWRCPCQKFPFAWLSSEGLSPHAIPFPAPIQILYRLVAVVAHQEQKVIIINNILFVFRSHISVVLSSSTPYIILFIDATKVSGSHNKH